MKGPSTGKAYQRGYSIGWAFDVPAHLRSGHRSSRLVRAATAGLDTPPSLWLTLERLESGAEGVTVTKRKLLAAMAGFMLAVCVIAYCFSAGPRGRISFDSYQKIQSGMTRAQAEGVLGGPARKDVQPTFDV